jgi:ketosteroid isomerase-like protein
MVNNSNENQIRILVENWAQAVREKAMYGAVAHHSYDVVMFDVPPPLQSRGIEAYRRTWELFFENDFDDEASFELVDLDITAGDTVAFCHALLRIGGSEEPQGRLTIGLQKVQGE